MASGFTQKGKLEIANQALNLVTESALKLMLVDSTYVHDDTDDFVATNAAAKEIAVAGYTGGFAGAGRRVPAGRGLSRDDPGGEIEFDFTDETWTALAAGVTIGGVLLIVEKTNDADSWVVAYDELTGDVPTNNGNIVYQPSAEGMLKF